MAKQVKRLTEFLKSKFYKHRVSFLTLFVILGLWLSYSLITWQACSDIDFWEAMEILITKRNWLIIAGLPVVFCLWLFRTKDRKDQIEKAEGQIQKTQENIQASLLSSGLKFLNSKKVMDRAVGLVLLLQLRNKERVYKDQIDIATPGTNLEGAHLGRADLRDARLQGANVLEAKFESAQYNAQTIFPHDNFKPEKHGMKFDP